MGEVPHRDFIDPYTGGLAYIDSEAFRFFGTNLLVLRYVLLSIFLAWVPTVFAIACEFCSEWPAAGVTLLAVAWSVPNYAAAVPSWFCLFFATFGILAIFRYIRQPRAYWLILAGLFGGSSILMKLPGLYFAAGILLFFVYREQFLSRQDETPPRRTAVYVGFVFLCLAVFLAALFRTVWSTAGAPEVLHFLVPALAIVALLILRERHPSKLTDLDRFKALGKMAIPFLGGVALPVLIFLINYLHLHAIRPLMTDLFASSFHRLTYARMSPPGWDSELPTVVLGLSLTERVPPSGFRLLASGGKVLVAIALLTSCFFSRLSYSLTLHALWGSIPIMSVAVTVVLLFWPQATNNKSPQPLDQQIVLLLSTTVTCSLVQFPYAAPIYFCYVAPLAILTAAALLSRLPSLPRPNLYLAWAFFTLFAVVLFRPGFLMRMDYGYHADEQIAQLNVPRAGGLRVSQEDAALYTELIPFVQQAASGQPILAGPDCPEVYFLSGLQNPTSSEFDFLQDLRSYERDITALIDQPDLIRVAVIDNDPGFSTSHLEVLRSLVVTRFPQSRQIGKFTVYWRP